MKTAKYFDKNSKKRDLSGDSNPEEERKKIRDGTRIFFFIRNRFMRNLEPGILK